jgi:hypothetical protein
MSDDLINDTRMLAESHGLEFKDCGNGHVQIRGMGRLVNYWPLSKKRTAHRNDGHKETNCRPYDAVKLCLTGTKAIKPDKAPSKEGPDFDLSPVKTNLAGLKHFYDGDEPPWEFESFRFNKASDRIRYRAFRMECRAAMLRVEADDKDEQESSNQVEA